MQQKEDAVIQVKDLYKIYRMGEEKVYALNGVSFEIHRGEFCAITGPSGSGKSTLLNMLAGLEHPTKGEIVIAGKHIEKLNEKMALINKSQFHTEAEGLKGYVKTTFEKVETKNTNGKTATSNIRNTYNELGQLTLHEQTSGSSTQGKQYYYHPDNTLSSVVTAKGNEKYIYKGSLLQKITFVNTKKRETTQSTFKYDANNRLIERTDFVTGVKGGIKTQYTYNANDSLVSTKIFKANLPKNTTTATFSNNKKQNETNINGRLKTVHTYTYNDKGDLSKDSINTNGKSSEITYEYTYDTQGNWTTRTQYNDGKVKEMIQRDIEYYSYK